jgi:3'-5' exoribonuclease
LGAEALAKAASRIDNYPMDRLPRLADLTVDDAGWGFFLCTYKEVRAGRSGSEFIILNLQDASGQATAKIMSDVERFKSDFEAGEFVRAEGKGSLYNGQVQLVLSTLRRVNPDQDRLQGFREDECILSAPRPIDEMWEELQAHLRAVTNDHLRVLLNRVVADNEAQLRIWPAAQQIHHAYRGGFLEHITKMAEVGRLVARAYGADEDLVLAGVILHDIGKLQELAYEGGTGSYTRDGNLVGHIALGLMLVRETVNGISGFPVELRAQVEHLVASHHGTREFGSPVEPKTIEAFILNSVDDLDAKINQVRRAIDEDPSSDEFTSWHKRLGRVLFKGQS